MKNHSPQLPLAWALVALTLSLAPLAAAAGIAAPPEPFPFEEATIEQLRGRMESGGLTAHALAAAFLSRIERIDRSGPTLRAVIEINPDALSIADALDAERAAGHVRGPLHGIPVLIKDNIATADRMQTTAGSLALVGSRPPRDAAIVKRLRDAGAVILGKANLSEWANFRDDHSLSGWSGRGGQTRNPYALDRSPSGSSSGSAVAVAANLCVVAIGTETDGSIISPASANGIVGMKPTVGLVSRSGVIPISVSQDTAGPMARTVRDAATLLTVLIGSDEADPATAKRPEGLPTDFAANLDQPALRGARVGVLRGPFGMPSKVDSILETALATMRAAGAEVIDLGTMPAITEVSDAEIEVLLYEFKDGLNAYLATLGDSAKAKKLSDLIAFNEAHRGEELPAFGQALFVKAQAKGPLTEKAYLEARATCLRRLGAEGIDALMEKHQLDTIVTISAGPAWIIDWVNGDTFTGASSTPAAITGYPSVSVPAGEVAGLPVGLSFTGKAWTDARQLALAADFESRTHARRLPTFAPTVKAPGEALGAQETTSSPKGENARSVVFIGNSFTYGDSSPVRFYRAETVTDLNGDGIGGVPALFKMFTKQARTNFSVSLETKPRANLDFHLTNEAAVAVLSQRWDYAVMQGQSLLDPNKPGDPRLLVDSAKKLADRLRSKNPKVDIRLVATWSRADQVYTNSGRWSGTPIERMALDIRAGYDLAAAAGAPAIRGVIPVGEAWNRAFNTGVADKNPYDGISANQVDLWAYDHNHASAFGYYLEALMIFGDLTGLDPRSLGKKERAACELGFKPELAAALQQVAFDELNAAKGRPQLQTFKPIVLDLVPCK